MHISYLDGHQAISFDPETHRACLIGNKCVGCHLCRLVRSEKAIKTARKVIKGNNHSKETVSADGSRDSGLQLKAKPGFSKRSPGFFLLYCHFYPTDRVGQFFEFVHCELHD